MLLSVTRDQLDFLILTALMYVLSRIPLVRYAV